MKKCFSILLALVMFLGALGFGIGIFSHAFQQPDNLRKALAKLDVQSIVVSELGKEYAFLGDLLDTPELKIILSSYTDGLVDYIVNGKEEIPVTKEEIRALFMTYSSTLLKQYPQLAFLPTEKFVDFMVEEIDLKDFLPSYQALIDKIPANYQPYLAVVKVLASPFLIALSLGAFLFALLVLLMISRDFAFKVGPLILFIAGGLFSMVVFWRQDLYKAFGLEAYSYLWPMLSYMLAYFIPIAIGYLILAFVFSVIGYFVGRRKTYV